MVSNANRVIDRYDISVEGLGNAHCLEVITTESYISCCTVRTDSPEVQVFVPCVSYRDEVLAHTQVMAGSEILQLYSNLLSLFFLLNPFKRSVF
jgi:hypothetical protein